MPIKDYTGMFRCPICASRMKVAEKSLICEDGGHRFDISKYGYVNFTTRAVRSRYDKQLFEARRAICNGGLFEPMYEVISKMAADGPESGRERVAILDAGCGEGTHLARIMDKLQEKPRLSGRVEGVGVDLAKDGIRYASRAYRHLLWCVADVARSPFAGKQFDCVLNILSPSNYAEFRRLLRNDGRIVKVVPGRHYLYPLREALLVRSDERGYSNDGTIGRFQASFARRFERERLQYTVAVSPDLLESLLRMTPLAWRATEDRIREVLRMGIREVTVDLEILTGLK